MNGRLRSGPLPAARLRWWHRNAGRLLALDAKWFGHVEALKPPNHHGI
jgi:hypothetical protein